GRPRAAPRADARPMVPPGRGRGGGRAAAFARGPPPARRLGGPRARRGRAARNRRRHPTHLPVRAQGLDALAAPRGGLPTTEEAGSDTKPMTPPMILADGTDSGPIDRIRAALNRALRGKADVVEHVLACLLARGHLLVEDLPGLGKTTLAKALAQALGGKF